MVVKGGMFSSALIILITNSGPEYALYYTEYSAKTGPQTVQRKNTKKWDSISIHVNTFEKCYSRKCSFPQNLSYILI